MSTLFVIQTAIEIIMALFVIWCFINEQKLIRFERKLMAVLVHNYRRKKVQKLRQQQLRVQRQRLRLHEQCAYKPETPSDGPLHVA
ncbi:MAG: hypothetical protein LBS36_03715 [Oscillospiraceae bacterium]|jgi:hypothetical protein|nr:hypothetical protein [Oscillospiraceae bacterium]